MKRIAFTLTTLAMAAVATVTLAGCSGNNSEFNDGDIEYPERTDSLIYVQEETGKITRYIDGYDGETLFDEGYTDTDLELIYDPMQSSHGVNGEVSLGNSYDFEGTTYPVATTVSWSYDYLNLQRSLELYNELVAPRYEAAKASGATPYPSPYDETAARFYNSVPYMVANAVTDAIEAEIGTGILPTPQIDVTGQVIQAADQKLVDAARAGKPAWQTLGELTGTMVTKIQYEYSYYCATYDLTLSNGEAISDVIEATTYGNLLSARAGLSSNWILTKTADPCAIVDTSDRVWEVESDAYTASTQPNNYNGSGDEKGPNQPAPTPPGNYNG